jgi:hypothetical protein
MIKFNTKRYGQVAVNFEYNYPYDTTATMMEDTKDKDVIGFAVVSKYVTDRWDKKLSRKLVYAKLLEAVDLDREDRTNAWDGFWLVCKI